MSFLNRSIAKDINGFVPLSGRDHHVVKVSMLAMAFSQLLSKCFTYSLLIGIKKRFAIVVFGGEMAVYFTYKIIRGEFRSYLPVKG